MPVRCRWILATIWLAFILRGAFYCQLIPLWEGYDEWGHYAFLEHLRLHPVTLPSDTDSVTEEIRLSVQSARFPHEAAEPLHLYEAQQPPLYYWLLSIPNRILSNEPLWPRVLTLRIISVFIASLVIPLAYLAAFELFYSRAIALSVCALIASMPALMIDIARIGNESLAIAIASWIVLLTLQKKAPALGFAIGLGLLTKAYFLAFLPILILRKRFYSLALALGMSGWWYWRNIARTGTLTGQSTEIAVRNTPLTAKLAIFLKMHWFRVLDSALWSHIWNGAWSFLTVKSWIYRVFELIFAMLAIMVIYGLVRRPIGRFKVKLARLSLLEILFAAGISGQALSMFMVQHISFAPGWYFYALISAEALLLASGMLILAGRIRVLLAMSILTGLFIALDLYTVNVVLARHYSWSPGGVLWILYLIATLALIKLSAAS